MKHEVPIPIALWVCAAFVVHALGSGGAAGVTYVEEDLAKDRASIRGMISEVNKNLDVVEVEGLPGKKHDKKPEELPDPSVDEHSVSATDAITDVLKEALGLDPNTKLEPEEKKDDKVEDEEKPPEEQAKAEPEPPKPEEEEEEKPKDPKKPAELVILKDNRISVRQITEKDQPDNPNAPRLAEKANTVDEETQSRMRSTDNVAKNPSAGSNQRGPTNDIGNSENNKLGQLEDAEGDRKRAPGENASTSPDNHHAVPKPPAPASVDKSGGPKPGAASPGGAASSDKTPSPAQPGSLGGKGPAAPDLITSDEGFSDEVSEAAPGGNGVGMTPGAARPAVPGSVASSIPKAPGLGAQGAAGKVSLSWNGFVSAVGEEQLEKERAAAGQKIRSQHRGRYDTNKFERWLPDIENYDPSVKLGNQTSLNAAQSAFATYLSTIHNAIHPIFADEFLALLNSLPRGHELNQGLVTHVEIIVSRDEGKILKMGVTKRSGSTVFDAAALEAINRASPFGVAPEAIVSPDGNVYLHWEFHRDPVDACSTRNAHPFLVKDPKPLKPSAPLKKKPKQKQPKKEGDPPGPGRSAADRPRKAAGAANKAAGSGGAPPSRMK